MKRGFRPEKRRAELPLTKTAAAAIGGTSGVNVDGYNDYRGVPTVGAWEWLPKYEMGILTKVDYDEAFRPLTILQWAFFSMFALLAASSVAIFVFTLVVARLQREAQKAAIEAKQLGQYRLETRLGAGAMGVVYKGHHAMQARASGVTPKRFAALASAPAFKSSCTALESALRAAQCRAVIPWFAEC